MKEGGEALKVLVGEQARGLSASTVSRLKQSCACEYQAWRDERLRERWAYVWADGVHSGLRAEQVKLCALVVIGVNEPGEKRFLAIEDGVRESTQSWREVLLHLKSRGMDVPELAIGGGAMEFWAALEETHGDTRQQQRGQREDCMAIGNATLISAKVGSTCCPAGTGLGRQGWHRRTVEGAARPFIEHLLVTSAQKVAGAKHPGNHSAAVRSDIGGFGVGSDFAWQGVAPFAGRPPLYRLDLGLSSPRFVISSMVLWRRAPAACSGFTL